MREGEGGASTSMEKFQRSMAGRVQLDPRRWTFAGWATVAYVVCLSLALIFFHDAYWPTYLAAFPVWRAGGHVVVEAFGPQGGHAVKGGGADRRIADGIDARLTNDEASADDGDRADDE